MTDNLVLGGLILNFAGSFILILVSLFGKWYQKNYANHWTKRYYWESWRPLFRIHPPSSRKEWKVKLNHIVLVEGFMPPKHLWNSIGFLLISIGFFLQLLNFLK